MVNIHCRTLVFRYELVTLNSCAAEQKLSLVPGKEKISCFDSVCIGAENGSLYWWAIINETAKCSGFDASQSCSDFRK